MGRIAGVWMRTGGEVAPEIAAAMEDALARYPSVSARVWIEGPVMLGAVNFASDAVSSFVDGQLGVVLDGRLDETEGLASRLGLRGARPRAEELVAVAYRRWGRDFPEHLEGDFAVAIADLERRSLVLARDFAGVRPLHFAAEGAMVAFGSEVKLIRAVPGIGIRPNLDLLAEVLLGGTPCASPWDTFFAGVLSVPPGSTVEFTPTTRLSFRYYRLPVSPASEEVVRNALPTFEHLFRVAVRRRAMDDGVPVGLLLSGGLDSSSILAMAVDERRRGRPVAEIMPATLEFPPGTPGDERLFVDALESRFEIGVRRVPVRMIPAVEDMERFAFIGEAPIDAASYSSREEAFSSFRKAGASTYLTGYWGDQILASRDYLVDLVHHFRLLRAARDLREAERWELSSTEGAYRRMFAEDLVRWSLPRAGVLGVRALRTHLRGPLGSAQWFARDLQLRATRMTTGRVVGGVGRGSVHTRALRASLEFPLTALGLDFNNKIGTSAGVEAAYPFLDRDLVAFAASMPGESIAFRGVPRGLQREVMRGLLPDEVRLRRTKGDGTSTVNREMEALIPELIERFSDPSTASIRLGLVDGPAFIAEARNLKGRLESTDSGALSRSLLSLLALDAWAGVYF